MSKFISASLFGLAAFVHTSGFASALGLAVLVAVAVLFLVWAIADALRETVQLRIDLEARAEHRREAVDAEHDDYLRELFNQSPPSRRRPF